MYRNTASFSGSNIVPTAHLPSPNKTIDDSDSEMSILLDQKRKQLDEEIAQFKAVKDKEFQEFEKSLRKQRQKRRREHRGKTDESSSTEPGSKPGALSLLAGASKEDAEINGNATHFTKDSQKTDGEKPAKRAPSSKPTISLVRRNIKGETTPPGPGSPLPTDHLSKQISRSPPNQNLAHTPPKGRSSKGLTSPPPGKEGHDSFAGVFTPSYLPLLESKANEDVLKSQIPGIKLQRHNSFSNSQTSSELISPVARSHRSQTAPTFPSTSLPSALRTASGTAVRRRKHVTFKLADSVVVDPSSSYEEMPSPEPRQESSEEMNGITELMGNGKAHPHAEHETDDEADNELTPPFWKRQIRSPTMKGRERNSSADTITDVPASGADPNLSPKSFEDTLDQADDGGSAVGFFELDEEIASPGFGEVRPFEIDDGDVDDPREEEKGRGRGSRGRHDGHGWADGKGNVYEYGGSVPINIVRPSGSWIGSFGH